MKELSLNILDIAQNSITAKATLIEIEIEENTKDSIIAVTISDNGCGMSEETLKKVTDPFYTSRTTRKIGLGIPLYKMEAEMTGGSFEIRSEVGAGTVNKAVFKTDSIDAIPLGDIISTICILIQGSPEIDFNFSHKKDDNIIELKTSDLRETLGADISLAEPEIIEWIKEFLKESYDVTLL